MQNFEKLFPSGYEQGGWLFHLPVVQAHNSNSRFAVNASATLTGAQVYGGYITSTSPSAVTMTLPSAASLGTLISAEQGTSFYFYIDNTAGAQTVTVATVATATLSQMAALSSNTQASGLMTITAGNVGGFQGVFTSTSQYYVVRDL